MTLQTIESLDLTLGKLFDDFYTVPSFQREYVWEEKQVEQLLQDIYEEFSSDARDLASEYFIGSIVVCAPPGGVYELIDGQQRMTTAYLTLCAIRDRLLELQPGSSTETLKKQIAATYLNEAGEDVFRYRLVLQYEDSCGVLETFAQGKAATASISASTRSVKNILNAYQVIQEFLRTSFSQDESAIKQFYAYLIHHVKLIRVKTISLAHALKVFETINDRGVGLDSMDLLKNLLFMQAKPEEFDKLKNKWKELVDLLYQAGEKPLRFLRYFIVAHYDEDRLREDEIYAWFVKNEARCGYKAKPLAFVDGLLKAARAYVCFIDGKDGAGTPNRYLINIRYLSGAARQHLILLLAAQELPAPLFNQLCLHLENLFFAYLITRENTREFERRFAQWTAELRAIRDQAALTTFVENRLKPDQANLAARFDLTFRELDERSLQRYRTRYILAKLTQYIDEHAWGSTGAQSNLDTYINGSIEIEHILPQNPSEEDRASFDQPEEIKKYIHRLGNLTLVEKAINASIGNGHFEAKRQVYRQSKFLLTKSLGEQVVVGANTAVNRAVEKLEPFEEWSSQAIERRQQMLVGLAQLVWDMPAVELAPATSALRREQGS